MICINWAMLDIVCNDEQWSITFSLKFIDISTYDCFIVRESS